MKSPARGGLTSAPQFLMFIDGCVELSWKWGVPKQYLKWEVVPDQPVEAEKPRLINFIVPFFAYSRSSWLEKEAGKAIGCV